MNRFEYSNQQDSTTHHGKGDYRHDEFNTEVTGTGTADQSGTSSLMLFTSRTLDLDGAVISENGSGLQVESHTDSWGASGGGTSHQSTTTVSEALTNDELANLPPVDDYSSVFHSHDVTVSESVDVFVSGTDSIIYGLRAGQLVPIKQVTERSNSNGSTASVSDATIDETSGTNTIEEKTTFFRYRSLVRDSSNNAYSVGSSSKVEKDLTTGEITSDVSASTTDSSRSGEHQADYDGLLKWRVVIWESNEDAGNDLVIYLHEEVGRSRELSTNDLYFHHIVDASGDRFTGTGSKGSVTSSLYNEEKNWENGVLLEEEYPPTDENSDDR